MRAKCTCTRKIEDLGTTGPPDCLMDSKRRSSALPIFVALSVILFASSVTAQIQVNSTSPSAAPQGTVKLNVTISGTGFENGDTVQWLVSGTTNAGGVTVNSTSRSEEHTSELQSP